MSGKTVTAEPSAIAIGWSMQTQIDQQRILTAQTHVPVDAEPEEIKKTLSKIADIMAWMSARYRAPLLEKEIEAEMYFRDEAMKQAGMIEQKAKAAWSASGRKGPFKLHNTEQAQKNNFETTITRHNQILADKSAELAGLKRMLNGAGAAGA